MSNATFNRAKFKLGDVVLVDYGIINNSPGMVVARGLFCGSDYRYLVKVPDSDNPSPLSSLIQNCNSIEEHLAGEDVGYYCAEFSIKLYVAEDNSSTHSNNSEDNGGLNLI